MARYTHSNAEINIRIFDYFPYTFSESYGSKELFDINVMG